MLEGNSRRKSLLECLLTSTNSIFWHLCLLFNKQISWTHLSLKKASREVKSLFISVAKRCSWCQCANCRDLKSKHEMQLFFEWRERLKLKVWRASEGYEWCYLNRIICSNIISMNELYLRVYECDVKKYHGIKFNRDFLSSNHQFFTSQTT